MSKKAEENKTQASSSTYAGNAISQRAKGLARKSVSNPLMKIKVTILLVKKLALVIKALVVGTKAFIAAMIAGGWVTVAIILICCLLGASLYLFSESERNIAPLSEEVLAYEMIITELARKEGIEEYVALIMAVMMQESGGRGNDPMQASESHFNTRFPRQPSSITDPVYSIEVGIRHLKYSLTLARVQNPVDMENIRLALQGYNFGNGYITWALEKHGGYSRANAIEFSLMMAERLGWTNYGDINYPDNVLRYYPFGNHSTNDSIGQDMVDLALSQVGQRGGQPYWSWYGFSSRVEWCATFVSWVANEFGLIESGELPKFAYCPTGATWFIQRGRWHGRNYVPDPGDVIFFDWNGDGVTEHVGIVERVEGNTIYTIEGNSGDVVRARSYQVGSGLIFGYGSLD